MSELERIIHDNSNGLDYILVGEIYLPLIAVPEEKREIGFYGSLHRNYLKDYKSGLYAILFEIFFRCMLTVLAAKQAQRW